MSAGKPHRVVIVGGGAGGLPLATRLGDRYGRDGTLQVTLVDRNATHVWKPLLHEVAAGRMDADAHDLDYLAIAHWHHFRFRQGAVSALEPRAARDRARRRRLRGRRGDPPAAHARVRHAGDLRRQREQRLRHPGRRAASDFARHAGRRRALPSSAARRLRARGWPRRRRPAGAGEHRDHRRRRHRRRAGGRDPADDARARRLRSRSPRSGQGHPADADRGVAAHPAAVVRTRRGRGDRTAGQARRRRAHRREGHRGARRRRAYGVGRLLPGRSHRVGGGHHGARSS